MNEHMSLTFSIERQMNDPYEPGTPNRAADEIAYEPDTPIE